MTRDELSRFVELTKELQSYHERIARLEQAATNTVAQLSGMPCGASISDKTAISVSIADLRTELSVKQERAEREYVKLCEYINTIDNAEMRRAVSLRYISGLTWRSIAVRIGARNTDKLRRSVCRYIDVMQGV